MNITRIIAIVVALAMFIPGCLAFLASIRLFRYWRVKGGLLTFLSEFSHGLLWPAIGVIVFLGALFGDLSLNLPWWVLVPVAIVFAADRITSGLLTLWLAGIVQESWFRRHSPPERKLD